MNKSLSLENTKFKTRITILEKEISKKDWFVEESMMMLPIAGDRGRGMKHKTSLINNLKRQVVELWT